MIKVTDRAKKELKQILSDNVDLVFASLRLLDRGEGVLGVGIDIESPDDHIIEYEGSNLLLIEPELIDKLQGITIDIDDMPGGPKLVWARNRP